MILTGSWDGAAARAATEAEARVVSLNSGEGAGAGSDETTSVLFADLKSYWREWPVVGLAPLIWLLFTFCVPVPGCPTGYLGPGGWADQGEHFNCTGGSHRAVDAALFGEGHFYDEPTSLVVYNSLTYDPEGFVGAFNGTFSDMCVLASS